MRLTLGVVLLPLLSATLALAQGGPKVEVFGGYSFLRASPAQSGAFTSDGWDASVVGMVTRWLGAEANVSDHYGTSPQDIGGISPNPLGTPIPYATGFAFLFGPHILYNRASRLAPFAHALVGGVRGKGTNLSTDIACGPALSPCAVSRSQTALGMMLGGGLDWRLNRSSSIRLIQVDYQRANFTGNPQNNVVVSAGLVLTFGN